MCYCCCLCVRPEGGVYLNAIVVRRHCGEYFGTFSIRSSGIYIQGDCNNVQYMQFNWNCCSAF
jgi:hypothetical protein